MVIIGDMSVIGVIMCGIVQQKIPRHVQLMDVIHLIGINQELDD